MNNKIDSNMNNKINNNNSDKINNNDNSDKILQIIDTEKIDIYCSNKFLDKYNYISTIKNVNVDNKFDIIATTINKTFDKTVEYKIYYNILIDLSDY